jgi:hypothetical protein
MIITTKNHNLDPREWVLWQHALKTCQPDGVFQQTAERIREALEPRGIKISSRTIQRSLQSLIKTGHLIEVKERYRDDGGKGWWIPATYKVVAEFLKDGIVLLGGNLKQHVKVGRS